MTSISEIAAFVAAHTCGQNQRIGIPETIRMAAEAWECEADVAAVDGPRKKLSVILEVRPPHSGVRAA